MGVDNVLAVGGAAHGSLLLVVIGLAVSIPIVIWGSTLVLKWVERYPGDPVAGRRGARLDGREDDRQRAAARAHAVRRTRRCARRCTSLIVGGPGRVPRAGVRSVPRIARSGCRARRCSRAWLAGSGLARRAARAGLDPGRRVAMGQEHRRFRRWIGLDSGRDLVNRRCSARCAPAAIARARRRARQSAVQRGQASACAKSAIRSSGILDADRHADQRIGDAHLRAARRAHLPEDRLRDGNRQRAVVAEVRRQHDDAQRGSGLEARRCAARELERQQRAGRAEQRRARAACCGCDGKPGIVHGAHLRMRRRGTRRAPARWRIGASIRSASVSAPTAMWCACSAASVPPQSRRPFLRICVMPHSAGFGALVAVGDVRKSRPVEEPGVGDARRRARCRGRRCTWSAR